MIDYLLTYPSAEARSAAFPPPEETPNVPAWEALGGTVMPVSIVVADAVVDADGEVVTPAVFGMGFWMAVRCEERSPTIEAILHCMIATDSDLATTGGNYVYFSRLPPDTTMGRVSPVFAGDGYAFMQGQPASTLNDWLISPT